MGYRIKSRFIYKQVGQRLKQLRNQKGVSQKVVADYSRGLQKKITVNNKFPLIHFLRRMRGFC